MEKVILVIDHIFKAVEALYPSAWRYDRLTSITPLKTADKVINVDGQDVYMWEFYPFEAGKELIIYYFVK